MGSISYCFAQYLAEKGTIFFGMNTFNGILTDDNVFVTNLWRMTYLQLQQSYVGSGNNSLPDTITEIMLCKKYSYY
jgi:hypothetical protein